MRSAGWSRSSSGLRTAPMAGHAAARRWVAPACRRARPCAPRCAPAGRNAVPAADPDGAAGTDDRALTGALPTPPLPRTALVTGGARRIGRALVLALAGDGFAVASHHPRP